MGLENAAFVASGCRAQGSDEIAHFSLRPVNKCKRDDIHLRRKSAN
jgi:hypothetical protein